MQEHKKLCHAGLYILLSKLRERFWILKRRRCVKKAISRCIICKRHSSKNVQSPPVSLPEDRVKEASVLEVAGVDIAGPFILKNGTKVWIIIYTCAVYRAVHCELIMSLSTDSFLLGFRRFITRQVRPKIICDNGTNFKGIDNLFNIIDWKQMRENRQSLEFSGNSFLQLQPGGAFGGSA